MSTVKTNNVQIGQSVTATNNFTWYQPASPDGTVRLGNGNSGSVTDLVTLTSAGNLGIGTSSPLAKTNVVSTGAALGGTAQLAIGSGTNNYENTYLRIDNSGNSNFCIDQIVGGTSLNRLFIERTTGNVGIGTSSPAQKLHLSAAGNLFAQFSDTTNSVTAYAGIYNAVQWIGTSTSHPITFNTANTERMRLDTSGNLGLGVTPKAWSSAYRAIEIGYAGNAIFASTSSAQLQFSSNAYFDGAWKYAANGTASNFLMLGGEYRWNIASNNLSGAGAALTFTQAMTLDASGNLLVGTTASDNAQLKAYKTSASGDVLRLTNATGSTGVAYVTFRYGSGQTETGYISTNGTTTAYNTSSDQRLKTNITPAGSAIQSILDFPVDQFDWIESGEHQDFGAVAQKAVNFIPEMVNAPADPEAIWGIDWSKAVPRLIKAIQELSAELNELKQKVNA